MPHYALARHVFVCVQGEHVVFLDVRKDRYFALDGALTAGLGDLVAGWPIAAPLLRIAARCRLSFPCCSTGRSSPFLMEAECGAHRH